MCQILQAPSWLTIQGPTGVLGWQTFEKSLQSEGWAMPLRTLSQIQAVCLLICLNTIPNFFCASYCSNSFFSRNPDTESRETAPFDITRFKDLIHHLFGFEVPFTGDCTRIGIVYPVCSFPHLSHQHEKPKQNIVRFKTSYDLRNRNCT